MYIDKIVVQEVEKIKYGVFPHFFTPTPSRVYLFLFHQNCFSKRTTSEHLRFVPIFASHQHPCGCIYSFVYDCFLFSCFLRVDRVQKVCVGVCVGVCGSVGVCGCMYIFVPAHKVMVKNAYITYKDI